MPGRTLKLNAGPRNRNGSPVFAAVPEGLAPDRGLRLIDGQGREHPCQRLATDPPVLCFLCPPLQAGEAVTLTLSESDEPAADAVQLVDRAGDRVDVTVRGAAFTSYRYGSDWARPFLMPLLGPAGLPVTRHYPVEEREGETKDHPHHKSCWVAWGDVNGTDNWSEAAGHARQAHRRFELIESGPVCGALQAKIDWVTAEGSRVLEETRRISFYGTPENARILDLEVSLHATEGDVTFGDTKEGGIASIRVATSMDAKGDGSIVNSYGATTEAETWGKRAEWCDYTGPVQGKTVGVAIFDTPGNFRYPTYWHVRDYGLMTANPFGLSHFRPGEGLDGTHVLARGQTLAFRYRILVHAGNTAEANVAGLFLDYVAPPRAEWV